MNFSEVNLDFTVRAFTFAVAIITSALFGLAPVLATSRLDLAQSLKEAGRSAGTARVEQPPRFERSRLGICAPRRNGSSDADLC